MSNERGKISITTFDPSSNTNHLNIRVPNQKSDVVFVRKLSKIDHLATIPFYILKATGSENRYFSRMEIAKLCVKHIVSYYEAKTLKDNHINLRLSIDRGLKILIVKNLVEYKEIKGNFVFKITDLGRKELSGAQEYVNNLGYDSLSPSAVRMTSNEVGLDKERFIIKIANDVYAKIVFSCLNSVYINHENKFKQGLAVEMLWITQNRCILSPIGLIVKYILNGGRHTRDLPFLASNYEYIISEYFQSLLSLGLIEIEEEKIVNPDLEALNSLLNRAQLAKATINEILIGLMEETAKIREKHNLLIIHRRDELIKLGFDPNKSFKELAAKLVSYKNSNEMTSIKPRTHKDAIEKVLENFDWTSIFKPTMSPQELGQFRRTPHNKLVLKSQKTERKRSRANIDVKKEVSESPPQMELNIAPKVEDKNDLVAKLLAELSEQRKLVDRLISQNTNKIIEHKSENKSSSSSKEKSVKEKSKKLKLDKTKSVTDRLITTLKSSSIKGLSFNEILYLSGMRGNKVLTDLNKLVTDKRVKKIKVVKNKEFQFYRYKIGS